MKKIYSRQDLDDLTKIILNDAVVATLITIDLNHYIVHFWAIQGCLDVSTGIVFSSYLFIFALYGGARLTANSRLNRRIRRMIKNRKKGG